MIKGKSRFLQGLFLTLVLPLVFLGCGEDELSDVDAKWAAREREFKNTVQEQAKREMQPIDLSSLAAPTAKSEETEETILKEPLREWIIGVMGPESGELSDFGKKTLNGVDLAMNEINNGGGIKGHIVKLFHRDTSGSVGGALNAAEAMIQMNVMSIIGSPTSDVTFSAIKPLNDTRTILFSAGTRRRIGDSGIYLFRNTLVDKTAISELIRYCIQEKGFKDFGLYISMVNDFSIELSASFKSSVILQGGRVTKELFLWPDTTTYITKKQSSIKFQILALQEDKLPDALIFTGDFEEGLKLLKTMEEVGVSIPLIAGEDLVEDRFLEEAGKIAAGMIAFTGFNRDDPEPVVRKFVADYKDKYGEMPDRISALAYDAVNIVLQAAEKAPSLRSGFLRKEISKIKDFRGVTGITSFSEIGEAYKSPVIVEVKEEAEQLKFVAMTDYR